jgi:hypothetical protein
MHSTIRGYIKSMGAAPKEYQMAKKKPVTLCCRKCQCRYSASYIEKNDGYCAQCYEDRVAELGIEGFPESIAAGLIGAEWKKARP